MATQLTNQATLNYNSGATSLSTASNTATITMQGPLEVTKYSLETNYQIGEPVTYNVFITNSSASTLTGLTAADNLGTYAISSSTNVTPLTYTGPAKIFINDVYNSTLAGTVSPEGDTVTFSLGSLAPGSTMLLQYKATVNEYANAVVGTSNIDNTVSITADGVSTPAVASTVLPVASYASVTIEKSMSPDPVVDGSTLTYTFVINNYGTIPATDVVLRDAFDPAPDITSVTVDGIVTTDYTYTAGIFRYPAIASSNNYTIPAAIFTQNPTTGVVTATPSTSIITIQGTI